jgi:hypothetical protein
VGGIRFYSAILGVEVGDTLHVELDLHGGLHMVVGTVVRASGQDGSAQEISLAFTDVDPELSGSSRRPWRQRSSKGPKGVSRRLRSRE